MSKRSKYVGLTKPDGSRVFHYRWIGPDGRRRSSSTGEAEVGDAYERALELREQAKQEARDPYVEHRRQRLSKHLDDWRTSLLASGSKPVYVEMTLSRVRKLADACGFKQWDNVDATRVQAYVVQLRERDQRAKRRGFGSRTRNYYVQAVKQFCKWMVENRRAPESPLRFLKREKGVKADQRHARRAFTEDELRTLLAFAEQDLSRFDVSGPDRAMLYRFAAETGMRSNEVRTLKWASLDLDGEQPSATVQAAYSKNGDGRTVPLGPSLACRLGRQRAQRAREGSEATVFRMPEPTNVARMLRGDLDRARAEWIADGDTDAERGRREASDFLLYVDSAGLYADFHSFRHTFASFLARSGVPVKTAMELLGHKTIAMTLEIYSHVLLPDQASAVAMALPDLENTDGRRAVKAG